MVTLVSPGIGRPRALIIVQNLPVPFDRRVWLECQALRDAGYRVTVICPRGEGAKRVQVIDDVEIRTYRQYAPGGSAAGFVLEYAYSFLATAWSALRSRRRGPFSVMQACNPPDVFWPLARLLRAWDGTRFVFDHHDLCPELYESRFPDGSRLAHRGLLLLERATFRTADRVCSTNRSYAEIAITRGRKSPRGRHGRAHRPRPDEAPPRRRGPCPSSGQASPRGLPRSDGAAGRGGPRPGGR